MTEQNGAYHIARSSVEPAAADFILDSYLMHIRTNRCACGAVEQWSDLLSVSVHRHNGTRRLSPQIDAPDRNYPVGISRLPVRALSMCHCCVLSSEPTARDLSQHNAQVEWAATLARKYAPGAKAPETAIAHAMTKASASKSTVRASVEDL